MISLYEHNQTAYDAAVEMLSLTGKAAVIHPTGTGKSFIGFKLCEQNPDKHICWISPSSYIFETQVEALKAATGGYEPENVNFLTYAKLSLLNAEELYSLRPDYIVLDEFHRCGAPVWGDAVEALLNIYPETPVLGLSATNIRYLDSQRDMALEIFDGNIASEMTLGEAVVRGILTPPKYVLSVFSYQKDLEKYQRRIKQARNPVIRTEAEKYLEALRRALENADGLEEVFYKHLPNKVGKYIVFCANREHMKQMIDKASDWFSMVDRKPFIYTVYSEDPTAEKSFREFKENNNPHHLKLLYCIDALNEGVHVKDISGVILLRPTISPIIYKQQIGRAMSASASHKIVIFDIVMNIDNLYSISSIRNEMESAINEYVLSGKGERVVNEQFEIIDEVRDCRALFERLNDVLSASWDKMFRCAAEYYETHGDLEVPYRYRTKEGYSLGQWVNNQRRIYNGQIYGTLTSTQKDKLETIGMRWERLGDVSWEKYFSAAKEYYEKNGNLMVPARYVTDTGINLGKWVSHVRGACSSERSDKLKYLTEERKDQLSKIGMVWDVLDYQWEEKFSVAMAYYEEHGNLDVPSKYITTNGVCLGNWISFLKANYKQEDHGSLTDEQISRLEAIGMSWQNKFHNKWLANYQEAKNYYNEHKHLDMPATYRNSKGTQLGAWVVRQREAYKNSRLDQGKIALLNEIEMVWEKADPWQTRYQLAKNFFEEKGHLRISQELVVDGVWLGRWVAYQRKKKDTLTQEQISLLEEIGMQW